MCFSMLPKRSPKFKHVQESAAGFLMLFSHVFIDAPEKLPKFGAFSTLGTALGQAEKTGAKELNVSDPEKPYKEKLEVTDK